MRGGGGKNRHAALEPPDLCCHQTERPIIFSFFYEVSVQLVVPMCDGVIRSATIRDTGARNKHLVRLYRAEWRLR